MKDSSGLRSLLLCGLLLVTVEAFTPSTLLSKPALYQTPRQSTSHLFESSGRDTTSDSDAPKRRRKRVKRKEAAAEVEEEQEEAVSDFQPRDDTLVQLQVQDVRDLVGGGAPKKPAAAAATKTSAPAPSAMSLSTPAVGEGLSDDSLKMLLEDAKEFRSLEADGGSVAPAGSEDSEGNFAMPEGARSILSTIVTIDFFIICGFFLWFLAGIFCSYVLKDDGVQIAFNQLFQPVVQPALGVLMLGTIAGSFEKSDEESA